VLLLLDELEHRCGQLHAIWVAVGVPFHQESFQRRLALGLVVSGRLVAPTISATFSTEAVLVVK